MWDIEQVKSFVWPDWQLCETLGRGSFGVVYKAKKEQQGVETFSAVKVILIPQSQDDYEEATASCGQAQAQGYLRKVVEDCVNEIRLMESLKANSNIVSIEDYKVEELVPGRQWCILIRMELLTGLNSYRETHLFGEKDIVALGSDMCEALKLCKARNIIHRDIKMANIFVNEFGRFKLGDFGIARRLDEFQNAKTRLGTLNYMAPEIYQGSGYDATVDIYSLGMVLYLIANQNRMPFLDANMEVITPKQKEDASFRRLHGEPLPLPGSVSGALGRVICKACAYCPADRYQTAEELQEALEDALKGGVQQNAQAGGAGGFGYGAGGLGNRQGGAYGAGVMGNGYGVNGAGGLGNGQGTYGAGGPGNENGYNGAVRAGNGTNSQEGTGSISVDRYYSDGGGLPKTQNPSDSKNILTMVVLPVLYLVIYNVFALLADVFSKFDEPVVCFSYGWVYAACILAVLMQVLSPRVRRHAEGEILLRMTGGIYTVLSTIVSVMGMFLGGSSIKPLLWVQVILTVFYLVLALWQTGANARGADRERSRERDNRVIEEAVIQLETAGTVITEPQLKGLLRTVADNLKASPRKSRPELQAVEQDMLCNAYAVRNAAESGAGSDDIRQALQSLQVLTAERERILRALH